MFHKTCYLHVRGLDKLNEKTSVRNFHCTNRQEYIVLRVTLIMTSVSHVMEYKKGYGAYVAFSAECFVTIS